jgi:hypothetical protein
MRLATTLALLGAASIMVGAVGQSKDAGVFFDDFSYADTASMVKGGWIVRSQKGWPGVEGARWGEAAIAVLDDDGGHGNRVVRMMALTDGTRDGTLQAQLCQQRKYFEGTYAARVRFTDKAAYGSSRDQIVQTFYAISPYVKDFDPEYSEMDFEYLPNGGWGARESTIFNTSWETFQLEPWVARNQSDRRAGPLEGWHTLVMVVSGGKVEYYLDGVRTASHGGKNYPRVPMSMNFNLWFIRDGVSPDKNPRAWHQEIDWAFHAKERVLTPQAVEAEVAALRSAGKGFLDTVPSLNLTCPCNF